MIIPRFYRVFTQIIDLSINSYRLYCMIAFSVKDGIDDASY